MNTGDSKIKDRLLNIKDIPTIPVIHNQILKMIEDANYSVDEISKLIERDQVLSTKVLKLVNSPFYGLYSEVAAVRRAIVLLGSNLIRGIILSTALFDIAEKKLPGLWDHSYGCSVVASFLAKRLDLSMVEEIMTGALLHDIGKVLIKKQLKEESEEIERTIQSAGKVMLDAEASIINMTHDRVGMWLAERWNFPGIIKDIISYHHKPGLCSANQKPASVVHLSDIIVKGIGITYSGDPFVPPLDEKGWRSLGLSDDDLTDILVEIMDIVQADKILSKYMPGAADG